MSEMNKIKNATKVAICLALTASTYIWAGDISSHNCRMWGMVSLRPESEIIMGHLSVEPNSLESLSVNNPNGWGIGYYLSGDSVPHLYRGQLAAYLDSMYDDAVEVVSRLRPKTAIAHVRRCSSGLCNIPNPHPFEREALGRSWLMAHNGTIDKEVLLELISPGYFAAHPPQYGSNESEWIDSELYFMLMLETIENFGGKVESALTRTVERIQEKTSPFRTLNFLLTDGETLWGYCEGNTLYYMYDSTDQECAAVASQPPSENETEWNQMPECYLATLRPNRPPVAKNIHEYYYEAPPCPGED
jgi:glutamine amidotransferase